MKYRVVFSLVTLFGPMVLGGQTVGEPGAGNREPGDSVLVPVSPLPSPNSLDSSQASDTNSNKAEQLLNEYTSDLGIRLNGRVEMRAEKNKSALCSGGSTSLFFDPSLNCRSAFEPLFDFQYNLRSVGGVGDRIHVDVDYDSQREFDASNNISLFYQGKRSEFVQRLEIGNVTFQPPQSRFITAGIPSGNYGLQAITKLGSARFKAIAARQKGNVVRDRLFTIGGGGSVALQTSDRKIEDFRFEPRRFFFTVDPALFTGYPNVDILNKTQMVRIAASLPDTLRPSRIYIYRLLIGGQPRNPNGPQFRIIGDARSRRGQVYEYLREGIDYYADPSQLWISLTRPLSANNERLVVAYRVRINGRDTIHVTTGGTPDLEYVPQREQFANLLWDPQITPSHPAFNREMRNVYRLGGNEIVRESVNLRIVTGSSADQEKPLNDFTETYLQLFGMAQRTNTARFDVENRLWPRPTDPNFEVNASGIGATMIRDQFIIFPSLKPFASNGLVGFGNPSNDTIYTTPSEYVNTVQRPRSLYHMRATYQTVGNSETGSLMLGAVQIRQNSERVLVDGLQLRRGADYIVDYDLGLVRFARPDTLFARPRQVTVHYEENPLFEENPTSIFGGSLEFPLDNGHFSLIALSQKQKTNYTRPPLGYEPASVLIAGLSASLTFDAPPLTRLVSKLPFGETSAPSQVTVSGEFAASQPRQKESMQAYIESFEGEGGLHVSLNDPSWYYSSQPAAGTQLLTRFGTNLLDLNRASTLAWQSNGLDANGNAVRYQIDEIDPQTSFTGTGIAPPEQLLWLTLYPLNIGGLRNQSTGQFDWNISNTPLGRRWRSIRTQLGPSGSDLTRVEYVEFWALLEANPARRTKNPVLVMDFGEVSENSVAFAPDTLVVQRNMITSQLDSIYTGRKQQGFDRLDSERDPFSRAFNADANDRGLPGDVIDTLNFVADTLGTPAPVVKLIDFRACAGGSRTVQTLGDSRTNCTIRNFRLDEEDIDADNVLNFTAAERDSESWRRYIIDLADQSTYNRVGKCGAAKPTVENPNPAPSDSVCWTFFRVPFRSPTDSLGQPLMRRTRALRITMISGGGLNDGEFSNTAIARLRLTGSSWLKRSEEALIGVGGEEADDAGFVAASVIGTQDKNSAGGVDYESPPGVTDAAADRTTPLSPNRVQINERSLRLTATDITLYRRAEAYYRFPEGEKNFMSYRQLRVWARGIRNGWGLDGELQFYVKIGRDANNFYMYRTPLNGGTSRAAWLPEVLIDFNKLYALRSKVQNAYLRGTEPNTCTGLDSILIANTPLPTGYVASQRYAACADGYIVYTLDPGVTPPNLAAVQEIAVGMIRANGAGGANPVVPGDTLELWVDDIRLSGVVSTTGFAGQFGLAMTASDFVDMRLNFVRKDPHFRQLAERPSYMGDNGVDMGVSIRLEKLLPKSFGYTMPLTFEHGSASSIPLFVSESDLEGESVDGLRTPRSSATSVTLGVKRSIPLTGSRWAPIVNNLAVTTSYATANTRSEYQDGKAHNFTLGADYNLLNALFPGLARFSPTEIHLVSLYTHGRDTRKSYLKPAAAIDDVPRVVSGFSNNWRNGTALMIRPAKSMALRWNIASVRDLRGYGVGEREREMQSSFSFSPYVTSWLKPRLEWESSYDMFHDPNAFTSDSILSGHRQHHHTHPRKLGNSQSLNVGTTLDVSRWRKMFQPVDINVSRSLLSVYDGTGMSAPFAYQLGLKNRRIRGELATSAGATTQLTINHSILLPFGFSFGNRYQRINTRKWILQSEDVASVGITQSLAKDQITVDGIQTVFPDISLRWSSKPVIFQDVISNIGLTARMLGTRLISNSPGYFTSAGGGGGGGSGADGAIVQDRGVVTVRSFPVNASVVWAGERPVTTSMGVSLVKRSEFRPGIDSKGGNTDVNVELAKPFKLPDHWKARSDLRTRLSYQLNNGESFVMNPLIVGNRSRLADNGREAYSFSTDTDVAENLAASFVVSRIMSVDRNLSRRLTQTVLSAVLHLQFYAGDLK